MAEFIGDRRDFTNYQQDLKTKKAVERNLEIIGEAVNRIVKADASIQLDNAKIVLVRRIELFMVMTTFQMN